MTDDDRAAVAAGAADGRRPRPPPARPRSRSCTACTTTSSRTGCCGSCYHGLFDLVRRPRVRPPLPRGVGRVRRGQRGVRRRGGRGRAPTATSCSCRTTSSRSCPAAPRARGPTCASSHFTHTPFCGPDGDPRAARPTSPRRSARRWPRSRPGSTPHRWAARVRGVGARGARPRRDVAPPFAAPLGPDPDALAEIAAEPTRTRAAADALDELVGDRLVILRTDRIEPSKNIVRGFLAYDRAARGAARVLRERRRVRRDALPVALRTSPSTSRTSSEVEQVVDRVNERWAHARLAADRARHARRLRAIDRRAAALRRAAREPDQGRAQPRRQGGPARQPARRRAVPLTRGRRVRRAARRGAARAPVRHRAGRGRARHRAGRCPPTSAPRARRACATLAARAHAAHLARRTAQPGAR